jgi:nanoRNase/pAp phosphatase (c-di-AMP/oligoRNAs hydrolase)
MISNRMNSEFFGKVIEKLKTASNILILLGPEAGGDDMAAGLALRQFCGKLEKEALIVSPGQINRKFSFLPKFDLILSDLKIGKSFVIDVSTKQSQIEELSYKKEGDRLSIFIKPKTGQFTSKDVSFRSSNFPFDLVVCVGLASLEQLGNFYSQNAELFFETPIINIDDRASNENFGQFNLVSLNATSVSEIIYDLINGYESSLIDESMATSLLTGIVAGTNSFQHSRTTPAAFLKASHLVSLGARQQEIVAQLFKNKSLGFLKLWGRVLARLKYNQNLSLVYSTVGTQDLAKAGATADDAAQIIKEMVAQLNFGKIFMFLHELSSDKTECYCATSGAAPLSNIFGRHKPSVSGQTVRFTLPISAAEAEKELIKDLETEVPA